MKLTGAYERSYVPVGQPYAECDDLSEKQSNRDVSCEAGSDVACRDDTLTDVMTSEIRQSRTMLLIIIHLQMLRYIKVYIFTM